jgi:hypothetical protein
MLAYVMMMVVLLPLLHKEGVAATASPQRQALKSHERSRFCPISRQAPKGAPATPPSGKRKVHPWM